MSGRLAGKTALITGGSEGIGLASARDFLDEGARVAICGRNPESLAAARDALGQDALAVQADVARLADLDALFATVRDEFGHLDVLFANAGYSVFRPFEEVTEDAFDGMIGANLKGTFFTIQKAVPLLRRGSSVIITSSVANHTGWPGTAVMAAVKAGQRSLARTISGELIDRGIRVNSLSPGPTDTPMFEKNGNDTDGIRKRLTELSPSKRYGTAGRWRSWRSISPPTNPHTSSPRTSRTTAESVPSEVDRRSGRRERCCRAFGLRDERATAMNSWT